jgi:hypothetical protein
MEYKKKMQDNKVANVLSRKDEDDLQEISLSVIAYPTLDWLSNLKRSYDQDPQVLSLLKQIQEGTSTESRYTIKEDILLHRKRL